MKCYRCGAYSSMLDVYYVDRNKNLFSESEKEAFFTLHPYANIDFKKIFICKICEYEIKKGGQ